MITSIDQIGTTVILDGPARRIVSLVPSQTAWFHALGLDDEMVGITRFCTLPDHWHKTKTRVGGTKDVHLDQVSALAPDLIVANREENVREQVEALSKIAPVWTSDVHDLDSAVGMMRGTAGLVGRENEAEALIEEMLIRFANMAPLGHPLRTAYIIWKDPWMIVGGDTFIHDMMSRCGLVNVFADRKRYPQTGLNELAAKHCELILLSSEPYPFKEQDRDRLAALFPGVRVECTDGVPFSWYGGPLLQAPAAFRALLDRLGG